MAAGLTLTSSTTALADDLDAAITVLTSSYQAFPQMAQVYTALHSGQLYQIALDAGAGYTYVPVSIKITRLTNGTPDTTAPLATLDAQSPTPIPGPNLGWRTYTLNPRVTVTAGTTYAIVTAAGTFGSLGNYFRWGYTQLSNANFTGGKMLVRYFNGGTWMPLGTSSWGFDFKTWVATSAKPPVIAADLPGSSANEGTAPTMTGTYSDPNGGTVTLTADHGTVTPQSGTGGTWSWKGDTWDENAAPATVTITATNSVGSTTATFPLVINGVDPVATITNDPGSIPEGSSVTLLGAATSPDPTDQAAGFNFAWSATKDGNPYSVPVSGTSFKLDVADEGLYVVTMTATDDGGMSGKTTMTIVGSDVTPIAKIVSVAPADSTLTIIAPQEMLNFNGTFVDPAQEPHYFRWDFGDGASSTLQNPSHSYAQAGTYTVTLTVTDDSNVAGQTTTTVTVQTTQQSLDSMIAYVNGLTTLNNGQKQSLIAKLNAASDAVARGDNKAAGNQLNAFINELEADLKTGKISASAYNTLRADAHALQGALGTYNRFLEWWPLPA